MPADKRERRPLDKAGVPKIALGNGDITSIAVLVPIQARRRTGARCWRCGVPFAQTTTEDLRRCAELAREAAS